MAHSTTNETGTTASNFPRAVVHKNILDEAKTSPKASIEHIAEKVSGATPDLVERVLEDYGDPGEENGDSIMDDNSAETISSATTGDSLEPEENTDAHSDTPSRPNELTNKQLITLRAIFNNPQATQVEIAEQLGVTNVTVCNRVNDIDAFDWRQREEFVNRLFGDENTGSDENLPTDEPDQPNGTKSQVENNDAHNGTVDSLEQPLSIKLDSYEVILKDPDLAAKIMRACICSDQVTEEEEIQIIKLFLCLNDSIG